MRSMTDRRRQTRSVFLAPADAHVEIVGDAVVESWSADRVVVTTLYAAAIGDRFMIETRSPSGSMQTWVATVNGCEPIISESPLRHRLRLSVTPLIPPANGATLTVM
jgi:hypothetical protein